MKPCKTSVLAFKSGWNRIRDRASWIHNWFKGDDWNDYAGLWIDSNDYLENDEDYVINREYAHETQLGKVTLLKYLVHFSISTHTYAIITLTFWLTDGMNDKMKLIFRGNRLQKRSKVP